MKKEMMLLAMLTMVLSSRAQTVEDFFKKGNDEYRSGKFREAAAAFESITRQGFSSPQVYFNLGNAYYRQGDRKSVV